MSKYDLFIAVKCLLSIGIVVVSASTAYSGFSIGAAGSVRQRVKQLDSQVVNQQNELIMTATTPPEPPSGLNAVLISALDVKLTWKDNSQNETHFVVERADDNLGTPINWQVVAGSLAAGTDEYTDRGLAGETVYWYRVKAVNRLVSSGYTNTAKCTTGSVGGGRWVDADGFGTESINIMQTSGSSLYPSLRLDSTGKPHIAWGDNTVGNNGIYYLKWNGTDWVDFTGSSGRESINISQTGRPSYIPSLCLDSSDNPHIAWYDNDWEIYYLKWNGTAWVDAGGVNRESMNISQNSGESYNPSLFLDSLNNPHVVWQDKSSGVYEIFYLKWTGIEWVDVEGSPGKESINISQTSGISVNPSLCLDSSDNPHIAWQELSSGVYEIYYLKWDGNAWVDVKGSSEKESINILQTVGASQYPSLFLDSSDNPNIAWQKLSSGVHEIYYLKWNGTAWVDADGTGRESINISQTSNNSTYPKLYLDDLNRPHIAWIDKSTGIQKNYYLRWNGDQWVDITGFGRDKMNISPTVSSSHHSSLAILNNKPHLSWSDYVPTGKSDIYYYKWVE